MEWFLQFGNTETERADKARPSGRTTLSDPREFLDNYLHSGNQLVAKIEAPDWLEARWRV